MKNYTDDELNQIEGDIANALLEAAAYRQNREFRTVNIVREGRLLFSFKVTGLDEDTWRKCRRQNLINRGKRNEELNDFRFISQAIFEATVDEDKHIWKNRDAWEKLNVTTPADLINIVLTAGEKSKLADVLIELSNFEDDTETLIKN